MRFSFSSRSATALAESFEAESARKNFPRSLPAYSLPRITTAAASDIGAVKRYILRAGKRRFVQRGRPQTITFEADGVVRGGGLPLSNNSPKSCHRRVLSAKSARGPQSS